MEERRKYVRIPENSRISYRCIPKEKFSDFLTKDISQGGIRFMIEEFIPKGSFLKIRLKLSKTSVAVEAIVKAVWIKGMPHSDEYEIGVQFVDIPQHAVQHLICYINDFLMNR